MSKVKLIRSVLLVVATLLACVFIYKLVILGCFWWECAPSRSFSVYDLDLPDIYFPVSAEIHPLRPDRIDSSIEEAVTANYWKKGLAIYSVQRFATKAKASSWYAREVGGYAFTSELRNTDQLSAIREYRSTFADEYSVKCGYILEDLRCIFAARYQEYYIFFSGSIGDDEMTQDNFIGVMKYLDERMQKLLRP